MLIHNSIKKQQLSSCTNCNIGTFKTKTLSYCFKTNYQMYYYTIHYTTLCFSIFTYTILNIYLFIYIFIALRFVFWGQMYLHIRLLRRYVFYKKTYKN